MECMAFKQSFTTSTGTPASKIVSEGFSVYFADIPIAKRARLCGLWTHWAPKYPEMRV